ncbi:putative regulator of cell autolysis [Galbibacter orientalis DSM 19592]|mgnify:FL=1|uniref:Putative regulator of cell autolysis n=2 Tax=Galbibacter TaxID=379068 RepID=I3CAA3_9FLAO|nr:putative regulator of cell autolysis [Galbibacter orientalis DSM 19592]
MVEYIKKNRAFLIALIIIPIFYMLDYFGVINIPEDEPLEVILITLFWWWVIALPIHNYNYLKRKGATILKVIVLIVVFIVALGVDTLMDMPDNPVTFILLMGFWIGVVYLLIPTFINKYWKLIALIYIPLFIYFLYLRLFSGGLEAYLEIKKEFPFYVFFLPIPVLFFVWVYEQWKWFRNLKAEKSKTELSLLRTQINPHFFFNTLNNLYALTVKQSEKAPEVILKLSDMMRYTIYEGEKDMVKIKDEIEYLNNYIELHKIRYKKSVEITFNHDVDTSLTIAPLLYIILLENAFKHGIETLAENAFVHINLNEETDFIIFSIENNFDPNEISLSKGIGLQNLKRRLSLLYKNKHELKVDVSNNLYITTLKIAKHA